MSKDKPTIVCICGSTRFWDELQEETRRLTLQGKIVLASGVNGKDKSKPELSLQREIALDLLHLDKIEMADEVLVINPGGYIGKSTRNEINYARSIGKPITFTCKETNHETK